MPRTWTPEQRAQHAEQMRAHWAARKRQAISFRAAAVPQNLAYLQEQLANPAPPPALAALAEERRLTAQAARRRWRQANPKQGKPTTSGRTITAEDFREWLRALHLTVPILAQLLGRTEAVVYLWASGDQAVPAYLVSWLELLSAFDKTVREHIPREDLLKVVYGYILEQPEGVEARAERVAQRLALPYGVVAEAMEQLKNEGVVR